MKCAILLIASVGWGSTLVGRIEAGYSLGDASVTVDLFGGDASLHIDAEGESAARSLTVCSALCSVNYGVRPGNNTLGFASIGTLSSSTFNFSLSGPSSGMASGTLNLLSGSNVIASEVIQALFSAEVAVPIPAGLDRIIDAIPDPVATTGGESVIANPEPSFLLLTGLLMGCAAYRARNHAPR